jgi:hypothetical protein
MYMALVSYDRKLYRRVGIEGAEVKTEGNLGDVVAYKPGTVRLRFEKL